jgi:4-hydroxythreonine-4-phosphate dehydrogenase
VLKHRIAITVGDPAGIGAEIILKSFLDPEIHNIANLVCIGNQAILQAQAARFGIPLQFCGPWVPSAPSKIPVFNVESPQLDQWQFGQVSSLCGIASFHYLEHAIKLAQDGKVQGIVTAPINKESWKAGGVPYTGHTEALAAIFNVQAETMFVVDQLRIFFLTRHFSLREAIEHITDARLLSLLHHAKVNLERFGIKGPRIAVAALNPHAGEHGLFGDEEIRILRPAICAAQKAGIRAVGPVPADSVFYKCLKGESDAVIALYHDQGHIAAKTYNFYKTISLTTGLPVIRTSVDHGTAFDIAGQGIANATSMIEAIRVAVSCISGSLNSLPPAQS